MNADAQQVVTVVGQMDAERALLASELLAAQGATAAAQSATATVQGQLTAAAGQVGVLNAANADLTAKLAALPKPLGSVRALFPGFESTRLIGHLMTWFDGSPVHCKNASRTPGYNQRIAACVTDHCAHIKAMGWDAVMPNMYPVGSAPNNGLLNYLPALVKAGLGIMPNIDKAIYSSAADPVAAIANYLVWMRGNIFSLPNCEKDADGKYVVTYFTSPNDQRATFAAIEADARFQDIRFVYNSPNVGANQMAWIQPDLANNTAWWLKTYAGRAGTLNIPGFGPGFDDTYVLNGATQSTWGGPVRIWPAGGPGMATILAMRDAIVSFYVDKPKPRWIQGFTLNDWDEGTAMEGRIGWVGQYFSA